MPNFRDVGGRPTRAGSRVRTGLLYRSTDFGAIGPDDADAIARLRIRTVYDLRTEPERATRPQCARLPVGTASIVVDVLGDSPGMTPTMMVPLLADPTAAAAVLGGDRGVRLFEDRYRDFVRLPSALAAYAGLFHELARGSVLPAVVHCTTGKDRTGWAVAILLTVLDVSGAAILEDYLASNDELEELSKPMLAAFAAHGGDPDLLAPVTGVRPSYLAAALHEAHARFGSMAGYLVDGLGLDAPTQDRLRAIFVEPG